MTTDTKQQDELFKGAVLFAIIGLVVVAVWVLISALHYVWTHPLF